MINTSFIGATRDLCHRVASAPPWTRRSNNKCRSKHKASRRNSSTDKEETLVNKLLYNAASLLHLDRSTAHCIYCKGSGFEMCGSCKGSGIHGTHASGGLETNRCLKCHGRGTCQCRHCQGKGRR